MRIYWQGLQMGDVNAFKFTFGHQAKLAEDGSVIGHIWNANFGEVRFACNGQSDCYARMANIEAAFALPYGDLLILNDDGTNSVNCVASLNTTTGVIPQNLVWSDAAGAQFLTWRSYSIQFTWETRLAGLLPTMLTSFTETVRVRGGTPLIRVQEPINVPVSRYDEFLLVPKQKYVVNQSGRATGLGSYPLAPAPLYPNPMTSDNATTTPKKLASGLSEMWPVEWNYTWELGELPSLPLASLWP